MTNRYFQCDSNNKHIISLDIPDNAYDKFLKLCDKLKRVCPHCKPLNIKINPIDEPKISSFDVHKSFACKNGHITNVSLFTNGMIHFKWDQGYINVEGNKENADDVIKTFKCKNLHNDKECNKKIKAVDDTILDYPGFINIKTKVRVGDIWDKAGCPEPKSSGYNNEMEFHESEFDKRNKNRISDMHNGKITVFDDKSGKQKVIKRERLNNPIGTPINKPTKKSYKHDKS